MSNALTNTTIVDGPRYHVHRVHLVSDGTEETGTAIVTVADLSPAPSTLRLAKAIVSGFGGDFQVTLLGDATTDLKLVTYSPATSNSGTFDYRDFGGLPNTADGTTGATGIINLTTTGLDNLDEFTLVLYWIKEYAAKDWSNYGR